MQQSFRRAAVNAPVRRVTPQQPLAVPLRRALRYLGYGAHAPDDTVQTMLEEESERLGALLAPCGCYTRVAVAPAGEDALALDGHALHSRALCRNLRGCREAFLFAATLGVEADRYIARAGRISAARGLLADALASAAAEEWCAQLNAQLPAGTYFLRPRFSPGYGDLSLNEQAFFLARLDAARQIGLTCTAGGMLAPVKSVTAVAGLAAQPVACARGECPDCEDANCPYRAQGGEDEA